MPLLFLNPDEEPRRLNGRVSADNRGDVKGETGLLGWGTKEDSMSWAVGEVGRAEGDAEVELEFITESRDRCEERSGESTLAVLPVFHK